ncbi:MAG TPA: lytic transglycosylase domain-containing protein, partial [Bacteroidales bacterium]|nr:lytic transglycosylase domain-containing protein [Bacteroidales bacterium]
KKNIIKIPILIIAGILIGMIISNLFIFSSKTEEKTRDIFNFQDSLFQYSVISPEIPDSVFFAGERVPLEYFDVYESLDMEMLINTYRHSSTILYIKRAERYFPIIEEILRQNGIPDDFKYLCVAESGLSNAISPSQAVGFWQFLKATAQEYKMEVNNNVDERYNVIASTQAACNYLKAAYRIFNSWSLAAVSYNMGMGGLSQRIKHQKVNTYWDLYLHEEPARYVYRIISLKLIMENPERYGFYMKDTDKYSPISTREVIVDTSINRLQEFAFSQGINYKMLKVFNPWLRDTLLVNRSGKKYTIVIPENGARIIAR